MSKKTIEDVICSCGSNKYTVDYDTETVPGQIVETIFCNGCGKLKGIPRVKFY